MRLLFALPGFHRYDRGAEVALLAVAEELAAEGDEVTVIGSGDRRTGTAYTYRRVPSVRREWFERFPRVPALRNETAWEDATFAAGLFSTVDIASYDATVTCSFPHTHWALRKRGRRGPAHFFVTQNGDWPARSDDAEYRLFHCDGLICTNPEYYAASNSRWNCALIPNGVNLDLFAPGPPNRAAWGLPEAGPVVLMVSALIPSKRVMEAIEALEQMKDVFLVVAGDGPLRDEAQQLAARCLPGRFKRLTLRPEQMPALYRSADVFLHMSRSESFGNVYVEAMASGLPVVAHDSDTLRWIVGEDQYLCDTDNASAVTERIRAALAHPREHDRARLKRFEWSAVAADYRAFIARTLGLAAHASHQGAHLASPPAGRAADSG